MSSPDKDLRHVCSQHAMLFTGAATSRGQQIRELVAAGARIDGVDGTTAPILLVARAGTATDLEVVIALGGSLTARDPDGATVLHHACSLIGARPDLRSDELARRLEVITLLLERGADVATVDRHGRTPLHGAVRSLDVASCAQLLDSASGRSAIDAVCDQGTALAVAVLHDNREVADLLVQRGAAITDHVLEVARQHRRHTLFARLRTARGEPVDHDDPLAMLTALAHDLGRIAAQSAVDSGDYDQYERIGNDPGDLAGEYWDAAYQPELSEAVEALSTTDRGRLPPPDALWEQLQDAYQTSFDET
jgi:Ankyrin repeats (3 copies)